MSVEGLLGRGLAWTGAATAGLSVALLVLGAPLGIPEASRGILSLEFAGTAERTSGIVRAWTAGGLLGTARAVQLLDTLFPFAYGAFGAGVCLRYGGGRRRVAAAAVGAAAFLDLAIENPLLDLALWGHTSGPTAGLASAAAAAKFALLGLAPVVAAARAGR